MIVFGAGSSIPFDIPGMVGFTEKYLEKFGDSELIKNIQESMKNSESILGIPFSFDLEILLSVLNDLSSELNKKPISAATASLLINLNMTISTARSKFGSEAKTRLQKLLQFIFETCLAPIKRGKIEGSFDFLDSFYGPLIMVLNQGTMGTIQDRVSRIFSTNWDLCFKTWADYVNTPLRDGTEIDKQSQPVLNVEQSIGTSGTFHYLPLHGSLDLIRNMRPKGKSAYEEILKISDPVSYFEDKPENMQKAFMIFPLEAIGYEESIRSPYFEMLYHFRSALKKESRIFIIGYSLRDPIISSIFEEVIAEKIREGQLSPLSENLEDRRKESTKNNFQLFVLCLNPEEIAENLRKQKNVNLLNTFIPIPINFPKVSDDDFKSKYQDTIKSLIFMFREAGFFNSPNLDSITEGIKSKYGLDVSS